MHCENFILYRPAVVAGLALAAIGAAIFINVYVSQHFHKFHYWRQATGSRGPGDPGFHAAGWDANFAWGAATTSSIMLYLGGIAGLLYAGSEIHSRIRAI